MLSMLIIFIAAVCITGLLGLGMQLFWSGLCGTTIDRHPLCGKCNYDLVGHTPRPNRCPECGSILARIGGMQIGHRVMQVPKILHGIVLVIINLSIVGFCWWTAEQPATANSVAITPIVRIVPIPLAVSAFSQTPIVVITAGSSLKRIDTPAKSSALNVDVWPSRGLIILGSDNSRESSISLDQLLLFDKQDNLLGSQAQPASGVIEKHIHKGVIGKAYWQLDRSFRKVAKYKRSKTNAKVSMLIISQRIDTNLIKAQRTVHVALGK